MYKIGLRPLIVGYLASRIRIEEEDFWNGINDIVNRLNDGGIDIDFEDNEDIELLLDYLEHTNYITRESKYICFNSYKIKIFSSEFISTRLFDEESPEILKRIFTIEEVKR